MIFYVSDKRRSLQYNTGMFMCLSLVKFMKFVWTLLKANKIATVCIWENNK